MSQPAGRPDRPARRARRVSSAIDVPEPGRDPCQCCDSTLAQVAGMRTVENVGTGNTFAAFLGVVSSPLARHITPRTMTWRPTGPFAVAIQQAGDRGGPVKPSAL